MWWRACQGARKRDRRRNLLPADRRGPSGGRSGSVLIAGSAEASVELGTSAPLGDVNFATEVVLVFNPPESSSCPYEPITSLRHDSSQNLVYPVVPTKGDGSDCTANAGQHRIVVAVQRADLPSGDFQLWINSPPGRPQGITVPTIDADTMTILANP